VAESGLASGTPASGSAAHLELLLLQSVPQPAAASEEARTIPSQKALILFFMIPQILRS
jgi:hypothetical protein